MSFYSMVAWSDVSDITYIGDTISGLTQNNEVEADFIFNEGV